MNLNCHFKDILWYTREEKRSSWNTAWQVLKGQTPVVLKPHETEQLCAIHTPLPLLYLPVECCQIWKIALDFHSLVRECVCNVWLCKWRRWKCLVTKMTSSVTFWKTSAHAVSIAALNKSNAAWMALYRLLLTQQWLRTGTDWLALLHLSEHCYNHRSSLE